MAPARRARRDRALRSQPEEPRRKGDKRERTRAKLIETTLAVVAERGFAGARLEEIASRAGMTKGSIYSNFGDKNELLLAAMSSAGFNLAPRYVPGATLREQLRATGQALVEALPSVSAAEKLNTEFLLYVMADPVLKLRLAEPYTHMFNRVGELLERNYGDELAVPARHLIVSIQALALGFFHQWSLTPDEVTPDVVFSAFDALAKGMAKGEPDQ